MGIFHRAGEPYGGGGHTTVVAPGTRITGNLESDGGLHIDGEVEGDVAARTYVIVAEGAVVHGQVNAREVYLGGIVVGDIWAVEVEIYGDGVCHGHIEAIKVIQESDKG